MKNKLLAQDGIIYPKMAVEYLAAKEAAHDQLAQHCEAGLRDLQGRGEGVNFEFTDHWNRTKQDKSTFPSLPIANRISRMFFNFHVPTWVQYRFEDGEISAELFQRIGGISFPESIRSVQLNVSVDPQDIPFSNFSEKDLLNAARTIGENMQLPAIAS